MHHCSRVGKNCLCQWLGAQEIILEREKQRKAVIETEKHKEADRLKEKDNGIQCVWEQEESPTNEPSLPCLNRCPVNPNICPTKPSLIMTPSTNPTLPGAPTTHTHTHPSAVTSRGNAGWWWESLPCCSCHIRSRARRPRAYACGKIVGWGGDSDGSGGIAAGGGGGGLLGLGLCLRASPALQKTPLNSG